MDRRLPSSLGLFVVAASTLFIAAFDAQAEDCDRYSSTPLGIQVDLLADPMPIFETGQVLPSLGAFAVKLRPAKQVVYPYKSPSDHDAGMGAVLAIEYVPPGTVRISLTGVAQLSAIQDNNMLPLARVEPTEACPGETPVDGNSVCWRTSHSADQRLDAYAAEDARDSCPSGARQQCSTRTAAGPVIQIATPCGASA